MLGDESTSITRIRCAEATEFYTSSIMVEKGDPEGVSGDIADRVSCGFLGWRRLRVRFVSSVRVKVSRKGGSLLTSVIGCRYGPHRSSAPMSDDTPRISHGLRRYPSLAEPNSPPSRGFHYGTYSIQYMCIHDHETMWILPHPDLIRLPAAHMLL